jgi:hypothetical protein
MSDINYPPGTFADIKGETHTDVLLIPPSNGKGYSDIFKTSHVQECVFDNITVEATEHKENGWDANRSCKRNKFTRLTMPGGGSTAVYLKRGFCDNIIDDVLITRYAQHTDWFEGDYADEGGEKCKRNTRNNVRREDAEPVRVRWTFLRAEKPVFTNSNVKYQWGWSLISTIYVEAKYLWVWKLRYLDSFKPTP